jgi:hypothetical protein
LYKIKVTQRHGEHRDFFCFFSVSSVSLCLLFSKGVTMWGTTPTMMKMRAREQGGELW